MTSSRVGGWAPRSPRAYRRLILGETKNETKRNETKRAALIPAARAARRKGVGGAGEVGSRGSCTDTRVCTGGGRGNETGERERIYERVEEREREREREDEKLTEESVSQEEKEDRN